MFKQSRALWISAILALLAIGCGFAGIGGALNVPIARPKGMDARDWANLWMGFSWLLIIAGGLTVFGIFFVWLVRALDKVESAFLNHDFKRKQ